MSSNFFSKNNRKFTTKNGVEYQRLLQEEPNDDIDKKNAKKGNANLFSKVFKSKHKEEKNKEEIKQIPQDKPLIQL